MTDINAFTITPEPLGLAEVYDLLHDHRPLQLSAEAKEAIVACRSYLDTKIKEAKDPIYGINTGFGSLCKVSVEGRDLARLQENLVRSHACGTGAVLEEEVVRLMLFLKARSLSFGHSGVRLPLVELLLACYNKAVYPLIYEQGSLGASGDLAPLAHLALTLMGEGECLIDGVVRPSKEVLAEKKINPLALQSKEGLALLNGTQFMLGLGMHGWFEWKKLDYFADFIASLSLDAYDGRSEPFDPLLHKVRPHQGQIETADRIREFLEGSTLIKRRKEHVQDPYSFRCIPQVHGASKDVMQHAAKVFTTEMNAVTDNPTIFPKEDKILSGGNFHGQTLALTLDHMAMAVAELASISERRTYLLVSGQRGLPPFLVTKPGLNSGLMIAQYTAASVVSQNKQLCTPASVDSIVSSNGQEDHVSMGANAATKALKVIDNLKTVLAIELIAASQALSFRKEQVGPFGRQMLDLFRAQVPLIEEDRVLSKDIAQARDFIDRFQIDRSLLF